MMGALIFGQGKAVAALVVESRDDVDDHQSLAARIWPTIEKANTQGPSWARIIHSMVLIASPEKQFARAIKGLLCEKHSLSRGTRGAYGYGIDSKGGSVGVMKLRSYIQGLG